MFLARRKRVRFTVMSRFPTWTHLGMVSKELRVGIQMPCKQRKQKGREVRTDWRESAKGAPPALWRGAAESLRSP